MSWRLGRWAPVAWSLSRLCGTAEAAQCVTPLGPSAVSSQSRALSAAAPPRTLPDFHSGYPAFLVAIICIGLLTAVIGDVASHFGCTVGLKDTVNAITFVALGTSVPGGWTRGYAAPDAAQ